MVQPVYELVRAHAEARGWGIGRTIDHLLRVGLRHDTLDEDDVAAAHLEVVFGVEALVRRHVEARLRAERRARNATSGEGRR